MDTTALNIRDFPSDLHRKIKAAAALQGITLKEFVEKALEKAIQEKAKK